MVHELKCWPEYFEAVISGAKTFEVKNTFSVRMMNAFSIIPACETCLILWRTKSNRRR